VKIGVAAGVALLVCLGCSSDHAHYKLSQVSSSAAEFVPARSTTHRPCSGAAYAAGDGGQCYELPGAPILGPGDISTKHLFFNDTNPSWDVFIALKPDAATKLDRWAASHPREILAIIDDSVVLVSSLLNSPPYHGNLMIHGLWEKPEAQRFLSAIGGRETTNEMNSEVPIPTSCANSIVSALQNGNVVKDC